MIMGFLKEAARRQSGQSMSLFEAALADDRDIRGAMARGDRPSIDGGERQFFSELWESLRSGQYKPFAVTPSGSIVPGPDYDDVRSNLLFAQYVHDGQGNVCGRYAADNLREGRQMQIPGVNRRLTEAAVQTSAFTNIIGQIAFSATLDVFDSPVFLANSLHTKQPATTLYQEMVPGIGMLGDVAEKVGEGEDYPEAGMTEEYIEIGRKQKKGFRVSVTEEAAWEDKTGLLMQRANAGAQSLAIEFEKEMLDMVLGVTTSYKRNGGPAQATYADTHTQGDFDNLAASNALVDWTDIETAELLFDAITDPNTGEPIMVIPNQIIVPSALRYTARRIMSATEIEHVDNQANAATIRTRSTNPVSGQAYEILSNQYVKGRTSSDSTWFLGDFRAAFGYSEVWPIQAQPLPMHGRERDIIGVIQWRRMGVPFVREPRKVVKCTG